MKIKCWVCAQGFFESLLEEKQCRNLHLAGLEYFSFSPDYIERDINLYNFSDLNGYNGFFLILNL